MSDETPSRSTVSEVRNGSSRSVMITSETSASVLRSSICSAVPSSTSTEIHEVGGRLAPHDQHRSCRHREVALDPPPPSSSNPVIVSPSMAKLGPSPSRSKSGPSLPSRTVTTVTTGECDAEHGGDQDDHGADGRQQAPQRRPPPSSLEAARATSGTAALARGSPQAAAPGRRPARSPGAISGSGSGVGLGLARGSTRGARPPARLLVRPSTPPRPSCRPGR